MARVKLGWTVRLKSGGPIMTVVKQAADAYGNGVECQWFNDGELKRGTFHEEALEDVYPMPPRSN